MRSQVTESTAILAGVRLFDAVDTREGHRQHPWPDRRSCWIRGATCAHTRLNEERFTTRKRSAPRVSEQAARLASRWIRASSARFHLHSVHRALHAQGAEATAGLTTDEPKLQVRRASVGSAFQQLALNFSAVPVCLKPRVIAALVSWGTVLSPKCLQNERRNVRTREDGREPIGAA